MKDLIVVRGGGDLATGTIYKLKKCGFPVLILEVAQPSAIRRNVAFCEAVYQGTQTVEDLKLLESEGVTILTCGTCLDFYGLKEKLGVGGVTNMYDIVERMEKAAQIIKP